jgi:hypothetical protein
MNTSVRFFKAMYNTYQMLIRENAIYRHRVREMKSITHELKESPAMIKALKKVRRKDKAKIQNYIKIYRTRTICYIRPIYTC